MSGIAPKKSEKINFDFIEEEQVSEEEEIVFYQLPHSYQVPPSTAKSLNASREIFLGEQETSMLDFNKKFRKFSLDKGSTEKILEPFVTQVQEKNSLREEFKKDQNVLLYKLRESGEVTQGQTIVSHFIDILKDLTSLTLTGATIIELSRILPLCKNLQSLTLKESKLSSLLLLKNCPFVNTLEELMLCHLPNLKDIFPINSLKKLKTCEFIGLPLVEDINALGECSGLKTLNLCTLSPNLTDISVLGKMQELDDLRLENLKGVSNISILKNCTSLIRLFLTLLSPDLKDISSIENLKKLRICGLKKLLGVTDISLLTKVEILQELTLTNLPFVTDISFLKECLQLTKVTLDLNQYKGELSGEEIKKAHTVPKQTKCLIM